MLAIMVVQLRNVFVSTVREVIKKGPEFIIITLRNSLGSLRVGSWLKTAYETAYKTMIPLENINALTGIRICFLGKAEQ